MVLWVTAILFATALLAIGGETAETLEEKVKELEGRAVPIHFEVKPAKDGEKRAKHLKLFHYEADRTVDLAEFLPLDLSAFIRHGLAKQGDKLNVYFGYDRPIVIVSIHRPSSSMRRVSEVRYYTIRIRQAGGISYVRLSEAKKLDASGREVNIAFPQVGSEEELYYVRVPFHLFPQLDGKALAEKAGLGPLHGYTFQFCYDPPDDDSDDGTMMGHYSCLVMSFGSGERAKELATPLYGNEYDKVHSIELWREVAVIGVKEEGHTRFEANPMLVTHSHVQYVVWANLDPPGHFHRMEPEFVKEHGQLVRVRRKDSNGLVAQLDAEGKPTKKPDLGEEVELVFEKYGKENRVAFPLRRCPEGEISLPYCLRTDEVIGEQQPHGMGVTYAYELDDDLTLEKRAEKLEGRNVLIYYEVKKLESGEKHLLLFEGDKRKDLAELLPLNISAFIERGLANPGDELDVHFRSHKVIARIRHPTTPSGTKGDDGPEYTLPIRQAGGIGYVRLPQIDQGGDLAGVDAKDQEQVDSWEEDKDKEKEEEEKENGEKLYYVRVPFNLFTKLDGEELQKKAGIGNFRSYESYTCLASAVPTEPSAAITMSYGTFTCLKLSFGSEHDTTTLVTPFYHHHPTDYASESDFSFITAKQVAHVSSGGQLSFNAGPKLASTSNVQYVVQAGLGPREFNRMELNFVHKYGRLVAQKPKIENGQIKLEFNKGGQSTLIPFRVQSCLWVTYCLRTGMRIKDGLEDEPEEMGVSYYYNSPWPMY